MKKANFLQKFIWKLQFKKVNLSNEQQNKGRCIYCDAGNPVTECSQYYCPCNEKQFLKRKYNFKLK